MFGIRTQEIILFFAVVVIPLTISLRMEKNQFRPRLQKILSIFAWYWIILVVESVVMSILSAYFRLNDVYFTFLWTRDTFNPFSFFTYFIMVVFLSPAIGAIVLRNKMAKEQRQKLKRRSPRAMALQQLPKTQ